MLGGGYALERHFANYFASRGYASVIVRRDPRTKTAAVEQLNQLFKDMVVDHKRVIDWLETQDDLDCSRLGIFGVSMGGIKGALLLPLEGRIQAAAIGLCGGDLPYILTRTTEPGLTKRREQEMRERNITLKPGCAKCSNTTPFATRATSIPEKCCSSWRVTTTWCPSRKVSNSRNKWATRKPS
jgi:hypothetical protein